MHRSYSVLLLLLGAAPHAHAQQAAGDLNDMQLRGRQVLAQACGVCHLPPTLGAKTYGPPLNQATAAGNDAAMRIIIQHGTERMPGFQHYLQPAEIDAIIAYVKTVKAQPATGTSVSKGDPR
jgi:mono/diheme cytochrome c family protein